jgi:CheY-like chemotaxis protein/predicted DNA binding protein
MTAGEQTTAGEIQVLLVDDDRMMQDLIVEQLTHEWPALRTHTAGNVQEALSVLTAHPEIDCVVSDYQMPDEDGIELLRRVRTEHGDLPFVLLTGEGSEQVAIQAIDVGVTDYVRKGIAPDLLAHRIQRAIASWQTERDLAESEARYRSITDDVLDRATSAQLVFDEEGVLVWLNATATRFFGIDRDAALHADRTSLVETLGSLVADPEAFTATVNAPVTDETEGNGFECRVLPDEDRDGRWLSFTSTPIESGLYAHGRLDTYTDVTNRKDRERALAEGRRLLSDLHAATRELLASTDPVEVAVVAVDAAATVLDLSAVAYLWDDAEGMLSPAAITPDVVGDVPALRDGSPGWDAFVEGERHVVETGESGPFEAHEALYFPLEHHGLLAVSVRNGDTIGDHIETAGTLAANATAALTRAARERELESQRSLLANQNDQLDRLNRINNVIRGVDRALVGASSRAEVEQTVCARLAEDGPYAFAWVADIVDDEVVPRAWAGEDHTYLDAFLADGTAEDRLDSPVGTVLQTGEAQVVESVLDDERLAPWRRAALSRGFQSVAAVPLSYDGTVYSALELVATRPHAFNEEELSVLIELGETIANAIIAVGRTHALLGHGAVELEYEVPQMEGFLYRLAAGLGCAVKLRGLIPQADGSYLAYFGTDCDPDDVIAFTNRSISTEQVRPVGTDEDGTLYEAVVSDVPVVGVLAERGGRVVDLSADADGGHVVVTLPGGVDVRDVTEALSARYPGTQLVARREMRTTSGVSNDIEDALTSRQREVLEAAYYGGYFEWPRVTSGTDLATSLDISPPTFHEHLRGALRKVLESVHDPNQLGPGDTRVEPLRE